MSRIQRDCEIVRTTPLYSSKNLHTIYLDIPTLFECVLQNVLDVARLHYIVAKRHIAVVTKVLRFVRLTHSAIEILLTMF